MFHSLWQKLKAFSDTGETAVKVFCTQMLLAITEGTSGVGGWDYGVP